MPKLQHPKGPPLDMGGYPEAYADGMANVDTYGPNAALTFFRVQRVDDSSRRVISARLVIPKSKLARIAHQLLDTETTTEYGADPERLHAVN